MDKKTNAMRILDSKKIQYEIYDYSDSDVISGVDVANYLKQDYKSVYKTLVTVGKSKSNYVFMIPVDKELDLKKAASSVNEKSIEMVKSKDLLSLTGYIHGGCSPIGMKKQFQTIIDKGAIDLEYITFSGGKIGYQVKLLVTDLEKIIKIRFEDIIVNN